MISLWYVFIEKKNQKKKNVPSFFLEKTYHKSQVRFLLGTFSHDTFWNSYAFLF